MIVSCSLQNQFQQSEKTLKKYEISGPHTHRLIGTVWYRDNSVQFLHYAAFIRKPVRKEKYSTLVDHWGLYNDKKIIITDGTEVTKSNGLYYFFSQ